ncbi:WD repeat and SOCS box-containing protein 1-like isoform X2 [Centruroides vittatus]|uniref:WD repeat and SOCS box-containing protein 1-like isoform X2 n=1 Tax=Centruroides vittatus TaxID=120091 RepID=UPI003510B557
MASFKNKKKEDIPTAKVLSHFPLTSEDNDTPSSGDCSTWHCSFAPDESYFAWSCGNNIVSVVSWDRRRQSPVKTEEKTESPIQKPLHIYTSFKIQSIAFGSTNNTNLISTAWWTRWSVSKNLVLATGHKNGYIRTWDVATGQLILHLTDHRDSVTALSFATNGSLLLLSCSSDHMLKIWDIIDNGNMCKTVKTSKPITTCSWSPNSKLIASVGGNVAHIWETNDFTLKTTLNGHHQRIISCKFSSDNSLIATASCDTRVILWQVQTGQILHIFGHFFPPPSKFSTPGKDGTWIRDLAFSQDGIHIATIAEDGYVRFWNILSNSENPEVIGEMDDPFCCAYSPSGSILAVGKFHHFCNRYFINDICCHVSLTGGIA